MITENQRSLLELVFRYGAITRSALLLILNLALRKRGKDELSRNAIRCGLLRCRDRELVTLHHAPGNVPFAVLTTKGARAIGVKPPRRLSPLVATLKLAVGDFCARENKTLLTDTELREYLVGIDPGLNVPKLDRGRFYLTDNGKLSYIDVSLGYPTALEVVQRLGRFGAKLDRQGRGWEALRYSFTLLSSVERALEVEAVARAEEFASDIHCFEVPFLRHCSGAEVESAK